MINPNNNLTVLLDDNSVFTDHTRDAADYARDSFTISMVAAEDYIMIGYDKPINAFYPELSTVATLSSELTGEYWNGMAWTVLEGFHDDSRGLTRSGFVQWDRDQTGETETTVDSKEMYWYRIAIDQGDTAILSGLNIVFNDLNDLKNEFFEIDDSEFLPSSGTYINTMVNARNNIIQRLRSMGYTTNGDLLGPWEMLDIHEIRLASTYYCLHKIFFNYSDAPDDIWAEKSLYYRAEYSKLINIVKVSIDSNDDGLSTGEVQKESKIVKFSR